MLIQTIPYKNTATFVFNNTGSYIVSDPLSSSPNMTSVTSNIKVIDSNDSKNNTVLSSLPLQSNSSFFPSLSSLKIPNTVGVLAASSVNYDYDNALNTSDLGIIDNYNIKSNTLNQNNVTLYVYTNWFNS
jgi:hypothetical protein